MATSTDGATAAPPSAQTDPYALRAEDARPAPRPSAAGCAGSAPASSCPPPSSAPVN